MRQLIILSLQQNTSQGKYTATVWSLKGKIRFLASPDDSPPAIHQKCVTAWETCVSSSKQTERSTRILGNAHTIDFLKQKDSKNGIFSKRKKIRFLQNLLSQKEVLSHFKSKSEAHLETLPTPKWQQPRWLALNETILSVSPRRPSMFPLLRW